MDLPAESRQQEGLSWLERQLAWEAVLTGLRRRAGVLASATDRAEQARTAA